MPGAPAGTAGGLWLVLEDVSELRRLQQIRAEFIDNLSHELRTPLTTVSLLAETLTREAETAGDTIPARMRDRIGKIEVETGHLVQMVSELLDLSRIESGGAIAAWTCSTSGRSRPNWPTAAAVCRPPGCRPRGRWPAACPRSGATSSDSGRSSSTCCTTRSSSARTAARCGSVVASGPEVVVASPTKGSASPSAQARIFERFYKVDRARVRGEAGGTGLGLAIARHIIEQHGGRIWVELVEGSGCTFSFTLPVAAQLAIGEG